MTSKMCLLMVLMLIIGSTSPALAVEEYIAEDVTSWNVSATDGVNCLATMELNNLDPNHEVEIYLDNYGKLYTLSIVCVKSFGWWNYNISLEYPNGTIVSEDLNSFQPFATDADIKIQYYWSSIHSMFDSILDVDVYIGLLPLTASFGDIALPSYSDIAFSEISGSSTVPGDLIIYFATADEFTEQQENDPLAALAETGADIFAWSWVQVLAFIANIPGIGPHLVTAIAILSILVGDGFWWFNLLFVQYPETTILTIEFFILSNAVIKTKRKSNIMALVDRIVSSHIAVIEFFYNVLLGLINAISSIISTIAAIVQGLKPL